ncbi:gamma-glutamyltransferase [Alkalicaulis satelles]|uniref:Glutathione hydrolase proenzyme n=1 Tax=Alkalicaulis satelles TaxID=2609175 RepID=A0A5M6ZHF7_9PROT|nr:gamma-glutamyltransferase [Alkalicaulis satelles]KAA5803565.1 gamma-glutamyltransferase [Alkalicaulis satelles]
MPGMNRLIIAAVTVLLAGLAPAALAQGGPPPGSYIIEYGSIHHPVVSRGGMVVSQNALASQIGAQVLSEGGNAVDAAVATGLALAVTLPRAGNLGGGGFMLVHLAEAGQTIAIEYYGEAPRAVEPGLLLGADGRVDRARRYSFLGAAVPGTPLGLYEAHQRFGRLDWADVVAPALRLAEDGILVTEDMAYALSIRRDWITQDPAAAAALYKAGGEPYAPGERLVQPDLAWSLTQYRDHGAAAFYEGEVAQRLIAAMQANGGIIGHEDLAAYQVRITEPLWSAYRGHPMALMPPPASGVLLAQMMAMLEQFDMAALGPQSAASLHHVAEVTRLVYADRARAMGGYPQHQTPVEALLGADYIAARAALVSPDAPLPSEDVQPGPAALAHNPDTTHYSVVDAQGNAVSNTYTLGSSYGAHVMAPGTGFFLNDAMGNFRWNEPPGSPNAPEPGKRVISTITPVIVFRDDRPWIVSGTPGGLQIIPAMAQFLVNMIDHGLNPAEASARPRAFQGYGATLDVEPGVSPDTIAVLEAMGHEVRQTLTMGSIQTIEMGQGVLYGASDTRRPGAGVAVSGARPAQTPED